MSDKEKSRSRVNIFGNSLEDWLMTFCAACGLSEAYTRVTLLTYIATRERGKVVQGIAYEADRVRDRDILLRVGHLDH